MNNILLYTKLTSLPDNLKAEVGDFIDFRTTKAKKKAEKAKPEVWQWKGHVYNEAGL